MTAAGTTTATSTVSPLRMSKSFNGVICGRLRIALKLRRAEEKIHSLIYARRQLEARVRQGAVQADADVPELMVEGVRNWLVRSTNRCAQWCFVIGIFSVAPSDSIV